MPAVHGAAGGGRDPGGRRRSCSARRTATTSRRAPTPARSRRPCWSSSAAASCSCGHSERRQRDGRDRRADQAARSPPRSAHGLTPILCVGETAEERRQGLTFTTVEGQLRAGLAGLDAGRDRAAACSPTSRCGPSAPASTPRPAQAAEVHGYLRGLLSELASKETAQAVRILYGGSVKADNADALAGRAGHRRRARRRRQPAARRASSPSSGRRPRRAPPREE